MAEVIVLPPIVRQEVHRVLGRDVLRVLCHELCGSVISVGSAQQTAVSLPFTESHSVGIVGSHSYKEMVKPRAMLRRSAGRNNSPKRTVHLLVLLHIDERIVVDVTEELHVRSTSYS